MKKLNRPYLFLVIGLISLAAINFSCNKEQLNLLIAAIGGGGNNPTATYNLEVVSHTVTADDVTNRSFSEPWLKTMDKTEIIGVNIKVNGNYKEDWSNKFFNNNGVYVGVITRLDDDSFSVAIRNSALNWKEGDIVTVTLMYE